MRIERTHDWATAASWATSSAGRCPFVGIAIGPGSDEGIARVGDDLLVAGNPLLLSSSRFVLSKIHPVGQFASIRTLEVVLFESMAELIAARGRASKLYSSAVGGVNVASDAAYTELLRVPFVQRKKARVSVRGASALPTMVRVSGVYWSAAAAELRSHVLGAVEVLEVEDGDTVAELASYYGGTDHGEEWTELVIEAKLSAGAAAELLTADALLSGEAG